MDVAAHRRNRSSDRCAQGGGLSFLGIVAMEGSNRCMLYCGGILLFQTKSVVALSMMVRLQVATRSVPEFFLPPTSIISMMNIDFLCLDMMV
jgi:hypothetical protein